MNYNKYNEVINGTETYKVIAKDLIDKFKYKSRRISAQLGMGFIQAKYSSQSKYLEIAPKQSDFVYLNALLKP